MAPRQHYVSNAAMLEAMVLYRKEVKAAIKAKRSADDMPRLPDYIGESFLKIADHLARKPNFASYTFREDMVADAVENCIQYAGNFDPAKSKNPFSYFTQIIYFAFLRRISREKKHLYVKYKAMEMQGMMNEATQHSDDATQHGPKINLYENIHEFIHTFETCRDQKKQEAPNKPKRRKSPKGIKNSLTPLFQ